MSLKKIIYYIEKITSAFEIIIALSLLVIIAVKVIEVFFGIAGIQMVIIAMEFEKILSTVLILVIGVEFIRMLCKHTPETVIDVLLFAVARQIVIYQENSLDLLLGIVAIVGLFAAKRFLVDKIFHKRSADTAHTNKPDGRV